MRPWSEITKEPFYIKASLVKRREYQDLYFNEYIEPQYEESEQKEAKETFREVTKEMDPTPSFQIPVEREPDFDPAMGLSPSLTEANKLLYQKPDLEYTPKKKRKTQAQKKQDDKKYSKESRFFDEKTQTAMEYRGHGQWEQLVPKKRIRKREQPGAGDWLAGIGMLANPMTAPVGISKLAKEGITKLLPEEYEDIDHADEDEKMLMYEKASDSKDNPLYAKKGEMTEDFTPTHKIDRATGEMEETWTHPAELAVGLTIGAALGPVGKPLQKALINVFGEFTFGAGDLLTGVGKKLGKEGVKKTVVDFSDKLSKKYGKKLAEEFEEKVVKEVAKEVPGFSKESIKEWKNIGKKPGKLKQIEHQLPKKAVEPGTMPGVSKSKDLQIPKGVKPAVLPKPPVKPPAKLPPKPPAKLPPSGGGKDLVPVDPKLPVKRKAGKGKKTEGEQAYDDYKYAQERVRTGKEKYAGAINVEKQKISEKAKQWEFDHFEKNYTKTKITKKNIFDRGVKRIKEYRKDKNILKKSIEDARKGKLNLDDVTAHKMLNADAVERLANAANDLEAGKISTKAFRAVEDEVGKFAFETVSEEATLTSAMMRSHQLELGKNRAMKAIGQLKKGMNARQRKEFTELAKDFDDPVKLHKFVKRLPDPKLQDYYWEYWYNSVLSGLPTHGVNLVGNTVWAGVYQPIHRGTTAAADLVISKLKGRQREVFFKEVFPMWAGWGKGRKKGWEGAKEVWKTGKSDAFEDKWSRDIGSEILGAFERSPNKWVRKIGSKLTYPTRGLRAMDVMANAMAYDSQMAALATRAGVKKGLKGKELVKFRQKMIENPTEAMIEDASKFAKHATFMDEPGKLANFMLNLREWPKLGLGRFVMPFVNTVANLTKRGIELTPGVGLALHKGQTPAQVAAKQLEGALIALSISGKIARGEVTGEWPESKAERQAWYRQRKKAWSIRIGDEWYSYRRVEPFNTVIASSFLFYDKVINAPDDKQAIIRFAEFANGMANNWVDSGYLSGMQDLFNKHGKLETAAQRQVGTLVPYSSLFRSFNRASQAIMEGETKLYDAKDVTGVLAQTIPMLYKLKKPRLNVWGREIVLQGNFFRQWLPYKWSTQTKDPVELMLKKFEVYPSVPGEDITILGREVKIKEEYLDKYRILFGHLAYSAMKIIALPPPDSEEGSIYNLDLADGQEVIGRIMDRIRNTALKAVRAKHVVDEGLPEKKIVGARNEAEEKDLNKRLDAAVTKIAHEEMKKGRAEVGKKAQKLVKDLVGEDE